MTITLATPARQYFEVSTLSPDGMILADLYSGPDVARKDAAVVRGADSARDRGSYVLVVRVLTIILGPFGDPFRTVNVLKG